MGLCWRGALMSVFTTSFIALNASPRALCMCLCPNCARRTVLGSHVSCTYAAVSSWSLLAISDACCLKLVGSLGVLTYASPSSHSLRILRLLSFSHCNVYITSAHLAASLNSSLSFLQSLMWHMSFSDTCAQILSAAFVLVLMAADCISNCASGTITPSSPSEVCTSNCSWSVVLGLSV